jgi:polyribonucleotide nucleotidyltransferase
MTVKRVEAQVGSKTVALETGKLAKQADGSVVISCGDTSALITAVALPTVREGIDFFPIRIDIEERMYAAGKIPGGFFRREGRMGEKGTLTARLTDRPLRPSFPDWFRHEVQVMAMIHGVDGENLWDVHCITGASAAMTLAGLPFVGPISGIRLGHIRGRWVANPTFAELEQATIELIVAGRPEGDDILVLMIEAGGFAHTVGLIKDGAAPPTEELLAEGLNESKRYIKQLCDLQTSLASQCDIPTRKWIKVADYGDDVQARVRELAEDRLKKALTIVGKQERREEIDAINLDVSTALAAPFLDREKEVSAALRTLLKKLMRRRVLDEGVRIGGRGLKELRPLNAEVGLLKRAHGSGLFERGETQALSATTLGMPRMEQMVDTIWPEDSKRFMHHYNFPPFSVGEVDGRLGPGRRDIGHGALIEKAVLPVVPAEEDFPYAIRVVSEILSSNGSTSMAGTCATTLALMDAGVPIRDIVAGISIGLISEEGRYVNITDIIGDEDNMGDMDFKVAGTKDFVTALQLDTKTTGVPTQALADAMIQAREARMQILEVMRSAIQAPRPETSELAPKIIIEIIPVDKIGEVIGPKGKNINEIVARCDVQIDIEDDGRVFIASKDADGAEKALKMIRAIAKPVPLEVGEEFEGTVVKTTDFGAFVQLMPGKDGLVHISKLGKGERIKRVEDVVKQGDRLWVRISEIRPDGKLSLVPIDGPGDGQVDEGAAYSED